MILRMEHKKEETSSKPMIHEQEHGEPKETFSLNACQYHKVKNDSTSSNVDSITSTNDGHKGDDNVVGSREIYISATQHSWT